MAKKGKKKGKLPIIMIVAVVIAGGGFFAMSQGKKAPEGPPPIELGAIEDLGGEFLVNLKDKRTFLKCKISVQVAKDAHVADPVAEGGGEHGAGGGTYAIARDAVIEVLTSKDLNDLTKDDAMKYLKREIAAAINASVHHPEEEEGKSEDKKESKEEGHDSGHEPEIDHAALDELGWDSEKGPVLRVFITEFAHQKY